MDLGSVGGWGRELQPGCGDLPEGSYEAMRGGGLGRLGGATGGQE